MLLTRATVFLLVISLMLPMTTSVFAEPIETARSVDSAPDFVRYVNHLKSDVSTGRLSASDADQKLQVYFTQLTLEGKDVLSEVIASLRMHADLPGSAILVERFEKAQKDLNRLKAKMESESQSTMAPEARLAFQRRWENAFISVLKPLQKDIERFSQTGSRFDDFFLALRRCDRCAGDCWDRHRPDHVFFESGSFGRKSRNCDSQTFAAAG